MSFWAGWFLDPIKDHALHRVRSPYSLWIERAPWPFLFLKWHWLLKRPGQLSWWMPPQSGFVFSTEAALSRIFCKLNSTMKYSGKSLPQCDVGPHAAPQQEPHDVTTADGAFPHWWKRALHRSPVKAYLFQGQWGRYLWEVLWPCTHTLFPLHLVILASIDNLCLDALGVAKWPFFKFYHSYIYRLHFSRTVSLSQLLLLKGQGENTFLLITE